MDITVEFLALAAPLAVFFIGMIWYYVTLMIARRYLNKYGTKTRYWSERGRKPSSSVAEGVIVEQPSICEPARVVPSGQDSNSAGKNEPTRRIRRNPFKRLKDFRR